MMHNVTNKGSGYNTATRMLTRNNTSIIKSDLEPIMPKTIQILSAFPNHKIFPLQTKKIINNYHRPMI